MKNYYKILTISPDASLLDVKKAYRKLALQYHPDKNKNANAHEKFIEITEAYEVLRDSPQRAIYDVQFKQFFGERIANNETKQTYQAQQEYWSNRGRSKAQEYASVQYEEFARMLLKEISIGVGYIPNLFAIVLSVVMGVAMLSLLPSTTEVGIGFTFLILLMSGGVFYLAYRLFLVAQKDYSTERKIKL